MKIASVFLSLRVYFEKLPMLTSPLIKEKNLPLEENKHVDENELATDEEWKLPYKRLR